MDCGLLPGFSTKKAHVFFSGRGNRRRLGILSQQLQRTKLGGGGDMSAGAAPGRVWRRSVSGDATLPMRPAKTQDGVGNWATGGTRNFRLMLGPIAAGGGR